MSETIRIQMMDEFVIYLNERQADHMVNKSKKGLALIEYLIANRGEPVSNRRLLSTFWNDENVTNPENALKTLISRVRTLHRSWATASSPTAARITGNVRRR